MKNPWTKFAVYFSAIAAAVRLFIHFAGLSSNKTPMIIMAVHLLMILLAIFLTIISKENRQDNQFSQIKADLKNGIKAGGIYSILTTAFVFVYFKFIDSNYLLLLKQERISETIKSLPSPDPAQIEKITQGAEMYSSLTFYCTVTTLGLLMATFTYAIVFAVINRFILSKFR